MLLSIVLSSLEDLLFKYATVDKGESNPISFGLIFESNTHRIVDEKILIFDILLKILTFMPLRSILPDEPPNNVNSTKWLTQLKGDHD